MIADKLKNNSLYRNIHPDFAKAFDFLEKAQNDFPEFGKYQIDGDKVFAVVQQYNTISAEDTKWEAHKKYIDIQYIHSGCEVIHWDTFENLPEGTEFDPDNDRYLYPGPDASRLELHGGRFAIFFPEDLHRPMEKYKDSEMITKIVVKVKVL